jgi:hypothetical protein
MVLSAVGNRVVGEMGDDPSFPGSYTSMSLSLSPSDQSSSFARRGLLELDLELDFVMRLRVVILLGRVLRGTLSPVDLKPD